ncbi:hypothetical protein SODALDRAFT_355705 [Sodiomyces alkalinus F11]|uniref:Uncharacterized protein n=1 Tax=Sodiomyces alkalinus (strain CBS 110278 / VKM F-3762 / F11) TaxID=1314773 RepID=A0A3N2Q9Q1_SODAK|nr:hypothetical protein SODALDRAFT_355705 [Sodiomyces alkalinus F11]ROT43493.1 hypothetical protein SODALDRAFT_355705 [Sodiomyces alkalinus F11]
MHGQQGVSGGVIEGSVSHGFVGGYVCFLNVFVGHNALHIWFTGRNSIMITTPATLACYLGSVYRLQVFRQSLPRLLRTLNGRQKHEAIYSSQHTRESSLSFRTLGPSHGIPLSRMSDRPSLFLLVRRSTFDHKRAGLSISSGGVRGRGVRRANGDIITAGGEMPNNSKSDLLSFLLVAPVASTLYLDHMEARSLTSAPIIGRKTLLGRQRLGDVLTVCGSSHLVSIAASNVRFNVKTQHPSFPRLFAVWISSLSLWHVQLSPWADGTMPLFLSIFSFLFQAGPILLPAIHMSIFLSVPLRILRNILCRSQHVLWQVSDNTNG